MKYFDLFKSTMRQSNQSIKKVTIYFLKPIDLSSLNTLHFTTTRSSTFSWFNFALLGVTTLPWHWEYHLVELGRKGELRLVMLPQAFQWWFVGVTFGWVVLAQKTLCNGAIKIVSKVSPLKILQTLDAFFFGTTLFFWMKGMAVDWRERFVHIIIQFFVNIIRITKHSLLNSVPLNEMELNKMTKGLALRPLYAKYPNPKPELFGQTRPEVKKPYSPGPGQEVSGQEWRSRSWTRIH